MSQVVVLRRIQPIAQTSQRVVLGEHIIQSGLELF